MNIYKETNEKLAKLSPRKLIEMANVELICTTDDPIDDLRWHELLASDKTMKTKVLPTFRPDKGINIELTGFSDWISSLAMVVGYEIKELETFKRVLAERIVFFHKHGCRLSDHALDFVNYEMTTTEEVALIFEKALRKETLSQSEIRKFKGHLLVYLGRLYHKYGWIQQYHIGALRNVSSRMYREIGPDAGYDSINDSLIALPLSQLLNALDETKELPKTILYTLNPSDYEVAITLMQAFQGDNIPGKIQFGAPWWFLDNIDGIFKQLKALGNNALLARFVGILTDSRSFFSLIPATSIFDASCAILSVVRS
jgi:glucuronate isomerase